MLLKVCEDGFVLYGIRTRCESSVLENVLSIDANSRTASIALPGVPASKMKLRPWNILAFQNSPPCTTGCSSLHSQMQATERGMKACGGTCGDDAVFVRR